MMKMNRTEIIVLGSILAFVLAVVLRTACVDLPEPPCTCGAGQGWCAIHGTWGPP